MNTHTSNSEKALLTEALFSNRIQHVPRSFIREILKVAVGKDMISFAGGLPNPQLFPVAELQESCNRVMLHTGQDALQYSNSEGYLPLREYIAQRYWQQQKIRINPVNILITSGSQQGLDLLGKVFINPGDRVVIEEPGYLGAIQAMSIFEPQFIPIPLEADGMYPEALNEACSRHSPKLMYVVPDFQNPSGQSYSDSTRKRIAGIVDQYNLLLVEDNPYSDIRFAGQRKKSFYEWLPEKTLLLGTFSKTAVPGFRLGWIVAPDAIMEKLIVAKQAADLHTNTFTQQVLFDFLTHNDLEKHIARIAHTYGAQCQAMTTAIEDHFPAEVTFSRPEGGMFLWAQLPPEWSSKKLFDRAIEQKVAFVPGAPFYVNKFNDSTLRLNFSCTHPDTIRKGIQVLGELLTLQRN